MAAVSRQCAAWATDGGHSHEYHDKTYFPGHAAGGRGGAHRQSGAGDGRAVQLFRPGAGVPAAGRAESGRRRRGEKRDGLSPCAAVPPVPYHMGAGGRHGGVRHTGRCGNHGEPRPAAGDTAGAGCRRGREQPVQQYAAAENRVLRPAAAGRHGAASVRRPGDGGGAGAEHAAAHSAGAGGGADPVGRAGRAAGTAYHRAAEPAGSGASAGKRYLRGAGAAAAAHGAPAPPDRPADGRAAAAVGGV